MTRLILLAAGASRRFGSQKLLADFEGKPLWRYAFESAAAANVPTVVVTRAGLLDREAAAFGFDTVLVPEGKGIGVSAAAGAACARPGENICYFVCDAPHLPGSTLKAFIQGFEESGKPLGRVRSGKLFGSPTAFSPIFRPQLLSLSEDEGGRSLFRGREEDTWYLDLPPQYLRDYDTPW